MTSPRSRKKQIDILFEKLAKRKILASHKRKLRKRFYNLHESGMPRGKEMVVPVDKPVSIRIADEYAKNELLLRKKKIHTSELARRRRTMSFSARRKITNIEWAEFDGLIQKIRMNPTSADRELASKRQVELTPKPRIGKKHQSSNLRMINQRIKKMINEGASRDEINEMIRQRIGSEALKMTPGGGFVDVYTLIRNLLNKRQFDRLSRRVTRLPTRAQRRARR